MKSKHYGDDLASDARKIIAMLEERGLSLTRAERREVTRDLKEYRQKSIIIWRNQSRASKAAWAKRRAAAVA